MEQKELCGQLETVDRSLFFLTAVVASVLLSFWSVGIQRRQVADAIAGETTQELPEVFPIKLTAGALVTGALGFFFALALDTLEQAERGEDPAALRSARINAWASLLVLAAALLRLDDVLFVQSNRKAPVQESTLPA